MACHRAPKAETRRRRRGYKTKDMQMHNRFNTQHGMLLFDCQLFTSGLLVGRCNSSSAVAEPCLLCNVSTCATCSCSCRCKYCFLLIVCMSQTFVWTLIDSCSGTHDANQQCDSYVLAPGNISSIIILNIIIVVRILVTLLQLNFRCAYD